MSDSAPFQTLKGFRDFRGIEAKRRAWLGQVFRNVFEYNGFEPLETPALEYEDLLLGKYGEEANKLIYGFEDRGGRRIALRYDQTVPTARVVAQYKNEIIFPYKRYQIQPVWRSDKPQKGRFREFVQCDIDVIGAQAPIADAQILLVISSVFRELGLETIIKINDRTQLFEMIRNAGIEEGMIFSVIQTIDKLDKKSGGEVVEELREKGITADRCDKLFEMLKNAKPSERLANIVSTAVSLGVPESELVFSSTLARGLDYYTGLIMEPIIPGYSGGSVGGGGRYDNLIGDLVGVPVPAVGIAFGFDRILEVLTELQKFPPSLLTPVQAMVAVFDETSVNYAASVVKLLHKNSVSSELYPDPGKKLESQIKYAVARGIPYVLIVGPEEQKNRMVTVKELATRDQKMMAVAEAIDLIVKKK